QAAEEKAENTRLSPFLEALTIGDLIKSTPRQKSTLTGDFNVTNDDATILKSNQLDSAAAKILINIPRVRDNEVGGGTSVCILTVELLREAEQLIAMKTHPQTVVDADRIVSTVAER
ncbi:hypothetical protein SCLCIDRAFT_126878, partial [Scleroderma citrinum Foug A]